MDGMTRRTTAAPVATPTPLDDPPLPAWLALLGAAALDAHPEAGARIMATLTTGAPAAQRSALRDLLQLGAVALGAHRGR